MLGYQDRGFLPMDNSAIAIIDTLIKQACVQQASDIHLEPQARSLRVRFRVDGLLRDFESLPGAAQPEIISRIKVLSGLRTDEHHSAQDGRFQAHFGGSRSVDVRVSIVPTYYGENAVLRLLADHNQDYSLESLGFSALNRQCVASALRQPHGMLLATGPTGSGKTTTLYTLIKSLNVPETSIITIEDPVEYAITGIKQIPVNAQSA